MEAAARRTGVCLGCGVACWAPAQLGLCPQLLEVNKQWDQHFRAMKQKYEQKVGLGAVSSGLIPLLGTEGARRRPRVGKGLGAVPC